MALYSVRDGRWYGVRRDRPSGPDPYGPDAPGAADRNRLTETALPNGMIRVDVGEPVKWLPSEALRSTTRTPAEPPSAPPVEPEPASLPAPEPRPVSPPRPRRDPWGLNRDEG